MSGAVGTTLEQGKSQVELERLLVELAPFDFKLRPPELRVRSVRRDVLSERSIRDHDIVVLTAGAGYGKTTLLAQSVRSRLPWAWLTLHREDNDPATLVAYLIRALRTAWTFAEEQVVQLSDPGASEISVLLPRLSRLIESIERPGVLVLDEINVIEDSRCLRILEAVLESAPVGLHVMLSGRALPAIGLERLRTTRRVLQLREEALAFTLEESLALTRCAQLDIEPGDLQRIHQAAEGWPAGIYLLALASQNPSRASFRPSTGLGAYLREQVLTGLDSTTITFLMRTSLLDVQDGPSCDAVLRANDSAVILGDLAESHLLVTPVDGTPGAYRYHGLLSEVLRSELERLHPEDVQILHSRASKHYAARGEREAAVRHALAAGDAGAAAELVWEYFPFLLGIGQGDTLASWLRGLGDDDFDTSPVFALVRALASCLSGDGRQSRLWLSMARRHPSDHALPDGSLLAFYLNTIEALICDHGVSAMVRTSREALATDPTETPFRCIPLHLAGCGLALLGDLEGAVPYLDEGIEIGALYPAAAVSGLTQKAAIAIIRDNWLDARRLVRQAREVFDHFRLENVPSQAPFPAIAGMVAAHDGELDQAAVFARRGRVLIGRIVEMAPWLAAETYLILGRLEQRLGRHSDAAQLADEARGALASIPDALSLQSNLGAFEDVLGTGHVPSEALTTAEIRLLSFLPTHLTFGQIADELCVSVNTVKSQAKAVYRKLDVISRHDAVSRATSLGLML